MDVINNRFGILLAEKRINEKRRVSISEVAKATGVSRQSLQAWENNTVTRFDLPVMDAICAYFNCVPGDLFEYIDPKDKERVLEAKAHSIFMDIITEDLK